MLNLLSKLIIGFLVSVVILVSLTGNLLVCVAINQDSRLHRTENLFLASLAVSDLLVAVLVMPLAALNDLLDHWLFNDTLCDAWVALDIMCSTASILNLCVINLDRYVHIKDPFKYSRIVTKKVAVGSIALVWILSAAISVLPISLGLHPSSHSHPSGCVLNLSPLYAVISSSISFCLPCLLMVCIYCRLYLYSCRQLKSISQLCPAQPPSKDHKAAVTIGVVMGVFLVCWLPFFSANILNAFCNSCVSMNAFKVLSWLGYSNSMFNPIIYTVLNSEFRHSFKLILFRRLSNQSLSSGS